MSKLINHSAMISSENGKYPFVIANSEKGGTHWWSILDIEPKTNIFFFDSLGFNGLTLHRTGQQKNNRKNVV